MGPFDVREGDGWLAPRTDEGPPFKFPEVRLRECSWVDILQAQPSNFKRFVEVGRGTFCAIYQFPTSLSSVVSVFILQSSSSRPVLRKVRSQ